MLRTNIRTKSKDKDEYFYTNMMIGSNKLRQNDNKDE